MYIYKFLKELSVIPNKTVVSKKYAICNPNLGNLLKIFYECNKNLKKGTIIDYIIGI